MEKQNKKNKLLSSSIILLSFGAAIMAIILISRNRATVQQLITRLGLAGPLLIISLYAGLALSPIPADPLTLITGAVYGPVGGILTAWLGMITATIVEYFIGKRIGDIIDFEKKRAGLPFGLGNLPADSILFLLAGRLLTGAGSKIVSYLSGIYRIPFWRYFWTSAVSTFFGSVLFALIGIGITELS